MNIFRLVADFTHLFTFLYLIHRILTKKSCYAISGKTQILYAMVFITRYLDLFVTFVSLYNSSFKIIFIMLNMFTLYLIFTKYKETYDKDGDKFRIEFLIFLCITLAMAFNAEFTILEILWTFSIYLEAIAIIPQVYMAYKSGTFDKDVSFYVLMLYSYRSLYIVNWIYRYEVETFYNPISIVSGIVQVCVYLIYLSLYWCKNEENENKDTAKKEALYPLYI